MMMIFLLKPGQDTNCDGGMMTMGFVGDIDYFGDIDDIGNIWVIFDNILVIRKLKTVEEN